MLLLKLLLMQMLAVFSQQLNLTDQQVQRIVRLLSISTS
jgi:hypothetical protein